MNEEEIIKNLNDLLEHNYLEDVGYLREENDYVVYNNAIQGLLDLHQKEKEKNKELSTIKEGIRVLQNNGLMDEQYIVIANWNLKNTSYKHLLDDYISKDKIREKIEAFKSVKQEIFSIEKKSGRASITYDIVRNDYCEKMLEELLKRRELICQ